MKKRVLTFLFLTVLCLTLFANTPLSLTPPVYASPDTLPSDGDAWTENDNATCTWANHPSASFDDALSFTSADTQVGTYALNITHTSDNTQIFVFGSVGSQDVANYAVLNGWFKISKDSWQNYLRIWLCADNSSGWYNSARWRVYCQPYFNTWFHVSIPLKAFLGDKTPTYLEFEHFAIEVIGLTSADNAEILIDGLHFDEDFTYYTTSNSIDYAVLPNLAGWIWYNEKTQTYGGTDYTSYYGFTQTDGTHDYESLESEVLGHMLYSLAYTYKDFEFPFLKPKLDDIATWLLCLQYDNDSSAGDGGFYAYYDGGMLGNFKDTYCGWILAGLSVYYDITGDATVKTACDDLRGFLCDTLWDDANDWFDTDFNPTTQAVTQKTAWNTMSDGAILAGLGAYLRYVADNSTIETIFSESYEKGKIRDHAEGGYHGLGWGSSVALEDLCYTYAGMFEGWKSMDNTGYRDEFLNITKVVFAQNMHTGNGTLYQQADFTSKPRNTWRKFDGWGMSLAVPLLMWAYEENSDSDILDIVKLLLYETYNTDDWKFNGSSGTHRYFGTDASTYYNQCYTPSTAFLWYGLLKWLETQGVDQPYPLSTSTNEALSSVSWDGETLSFTASASSGVTTTTYVYCGNHGKPKRVSGATDWSYDASMKIATIEVSHTSAQLVGVSFGGAGSADFKLTVRVTRNLFPWTATVNVNGENRSGLGIIEFSVPYGTYDVTVYCDGLVQTKEVGVMADTTVGFEFPREPVSLPPDLWVFSVPFVLIFVGAVFLVLRRRRR